MLANRVAHTLNSDRFGRARFLAFYQPYVVPQAFVSTHHEIRERLAMIEYAFDVSSAYEALGEDAYSDHVHVNQEARDVMAALMAEIIVSRCDAGERQAERHVAAEPPAIASPRRDPPG